MTTPTSSTWSRYLLAATGTATVAASSASAAIVYWNPADVTAFQSPPGPPINFFSFDMLEGLVSTTEGRSATAFEVDVSGDYVQVKNMEVPVPSGIVSTFAGAAFLVSKLAPGTLIDGSSTFNIGYDSAFFDFGGYYATDWNTAGDGVTGYVGLKFEIQSGETHYGWARFTYNDASNNIVLNDFAYEDVAGVGILAGAGASPIPEPGSAALVAALAAGSVATYRRRRQAA